MSDVTTGLLTSLGMVVTLTLVVVGGNYGLNTIRRLLRGPAEDDVEAEGDDT